MAQTARKTKTKTKAKNKLTSKKKTKLPTRKAAKKTAKKIAKKTTKKALKKPLKKVAKKVAKKTTKKTVAKKTVLKRAAISTKAPVVVPIQVVETVARIGAGDAAPEFTLPNQSGEPVSLSSFRGKKVVLYFYPKDDTPGCTKEACNFRDNIASFDGQDAVIVGLSFDDAESHQKFIGKYQLNFNLLSDETKETAKAYGTFVQKNMYGNISWGIERSTFVIDREGKIAAAFRRVNVDGHTEEVLEALKTIA